ncbi:hypothetical protein C8R45DRAFT_1212941 [Mycena sanguinolenta]|nr:hypothetical protein C8R45DRAFT_1212941 [Mycena sanguinolenta]
MMRLIASSPLTTTTPTLAVDIVLDNLLGILLLLIIFTHASAHLNGSPPFPCPVLTFCDVCYTSPTAGPLIVVPLASRLHDRFAPAIGGSSPLVLPLLNLNMHLLNLNMHLLNLNITMRIKPHMTLRRINTVKARQDEARWLVTCVKLHASSIPVRPQI